MNGTYNLKLFISISIGLHLFLFSLLSVLLPDFKIIPFRPLHIEVSLLPLAREEKEPLKKVGDMEKVRSFPDHAKASASREFGVRSIEESPKIVKSRETEIKNESVPVIDEEKKISQVEKMEVPLPKREEESITVPPVQSENRVVSISQPQPAPLEIEKKEREIRKEERVVVASLGNPLPQSSSSEKPQTAMKGPALSDSEIVWAQPRYAENPNPLYPKEAKRKGYEGEVLLRVEVLSNGRVGAIEVKRSSGYDLLDRSAMTAVKQWKFIPAKKGETPVSVWVNIPIAFQLR